MLHSNVLNDFLLNSKFKKNNLFLNADQWLPIYSHYYLSLILIGCPQIAKQRIQRGDKFFVEHHNHVPSVRRQIHFGVVEILCMRRRNCRLLCGRRRRRGLHRRVDNRGRAFGLQRFEFFLMIGRRITRPLHFDVCSLSARQYYALRRI